VSRTPKPQDRPIPDVNKRLRRQTTTPYTVELVFVIDYKLYTTYVHIELKVKSCKRTYKRM